MVQVPLVSVNLSTVAIESFCYGIFFILTISATSLSLYKFRGNGPAGGNRSLFWQPMTYGTIGLFITITAHWICTIIRLFEAFVTFDQGSNPLAFYGDLSRITEVVKTGFLMASLILGDTMIIYRLWIVWNYSIYVIVFPLFSLLGLTVCGVGITYQFTQYVPGMDVFESEAGRWITSDCVFTLCTNLYSTSMISWKIWNVNHHAVVMRYSSQSLMSILGIVVESAAVYTAWTTFFFASYQSHSNLQFVAVDVWPCSAGIAFMLINVRVGLGWAQKANQDSFKSYNTSSRPFNSRGEIQQSGRDAFPMHPLAVSITQAIEFGRDTTDNEELRGEQFK
ncbi:hypothetical protein C8R41DRAFT_887287 [Lentinula lateritia]|uniref:Uncharacterized protein n=1 Tax=Lentinula lateritia TaxID=40482 RepID=A0ABQ8V6U9_9AGAR|nr:hypothetical protein C8R41DRAFT_887287 [Lentinula lateritia]